MTTLRAPGFWRLAADAPAEVLRQRRPGAHRKDTGLLARRFHQRRTVACREHVRVVQELQRRPDREEAARIARKTGAGEPARRRRIGREQNGVSLDVRATIERDGARRELPRTALLVHLDFFFSEHAAKNVADTCIV